MTRSLGHTRLVSLGNAVPPQHQALQRRPRRLKAYHASGRQDDAGRRYDIDSVRCDLPIECAAELTPVVAGKEAGASWNARGMEKTVDFWSRKEYIVRASGWTPGKIAGHDQGQAWRLDQLVLGETARNQ